MNLSKSSNCGSKQNFMHKTGWCTKLSSLQRGYLNQVINFERHGNNDMTNTATHQLIKSEYAVCICRYN